MNETSESKATPGVVTSSPVVTRVFDELLEAVHDGSLQPGQRINDAQLAEHFGVSRTPIREALQRLREIGIVEASASRFTRIADVTPQQTAQAMAVWISLFSLLLEEVIPECPREVLPQLEADHAEYLEALPSLEVQRIAIANFTFVNRLVVHSDNPFLQKALTGVVHVVRLGSLHLPDYIDFVALTEVQRLVIAAARDCDAESAQRAISALRAIEIPQN